MMSNREVIEIFYVENNGSLFSGSGCSFTNGFNEMVRVEISRVEKKKELTLNIIDDLERLKNSISNIINKVY